MESKHLIALSAREISVYRLTTQQELRFKGVPAVPLSALTSVFVISEAP